MNRWLRLGALVLIRLVANCRPRPTSPLALKPLLLACTLVLSALLPLPALAEEFTGYGPLPVRDFQPIQLIFLNLPFERARALRPGELAFHLESAESNEIATNQASDTANIDATLKFETNRTVLGGTLGVLPGLEIGLDVPMISRFGGFLDPFVDSVESLFGTSNIERSLYPNNTFGAFNVQRGDTVLFQGRDQQFSLGDIWTSAKYEVWHPEGFPLFSLRGAIKFPTGRAGGVYGSGKPDFGLGVAAEQQFLSWLIAYANLDVVYPVGPITQGDLTLNPILIEHVGGEAYLGWHISYVLQQDLYTSPMHGTGARLLDGTGVEISTGFNWMWHPLLCQLGMIDNISPVVATADFTLFARLTYFHQ